MAKSAVPKKTEAIDVPLETVLWALGKLHEELCFYQTLDKMKAGKVSATLQREITTVSDVRERLLSGQLIIKPSEKKEGKNAKASAGRSKQKQDR
jgi:hypothetical protein